MEIVSNLPLSGSCSVPDCAASLAELPLQQTAPLPPALGPQTLTSRPPSALGPSHLLLQAAKYAYRQRTQVDASGQAGAFQPACTRLDAALQTLALLCDWNVSEWEQSPLTALPRYKGTCGATSLPFSTNPVLLSGPHGQRHQANNAFEVR